MGGANEAEVDLPTTFGKYYLTEKLATGGMAEIYLAKLIGPGGFEKQLVIKQIHPKLSGQRHFVDLFVAEAKTLVSLAHGNIVPVYELGVVDDVYFIAMDYIDGPTLYRLTETMARRDAVMEPALAAWIVARILDGLAYAHRKGDGVIHRDLSPRNVMLSRDGEVKLVDFGIAVTLGEGDSAGGEQSAPTGSFPYMSPEQVRREGLTGQTDLFSAGVLFWEMLAGKRLFARADADATLDAVLSAEIAPPSRRRGEVPERLDDIAMRALERDRGARWPDAGEFLAALNRYLYALDATPGPRDVAALVARFCPPETRRLPTHLEAIAHDAASSAAAPAEAAVEVPAGPRTAVIPRDGSPRGRAKRAQTQTFATNVELEKVFGPASEPSRPDAQAVEDDGAKPLPIPGRRPPSRAALVAVGLGGLALAAAAIYIFYSNRERVLRADARVVAIATADASADAPPPIDAALSDAEERSIDAAVAASPSIDAGVHRPPRDATVTARVPIDSAAAPTAIDAGAIATATLIIGADPWATVYVDGKKQAKTAPASFIVAAGHHAVELVFSPEGAPEQRKHFEVDVAADEKRALQWGFAP
jgi:tRNA A-37 threonylcarbamoyl transferase component Bud32